MIKGFCGPTDAGMARSRVILPIVWTAGTFRRPTPAHYRASRSFLLSYPGRRLWRSWGARNILAGPRPLTLPRVFPFPVGLSSEVRRLLGD